MVRAVLLLALAGVAFGARYEFKGYVVPEKVADDATLMQVEDLLRGQIKESEFFLHRVDYNEMNNGLLTFIGYFESSSNSAELISRYEKSDGFAIVFLRLLTGIEPTPIQPTILADTAPCQNGGTLLFNGTCACGPFTSGTKCETTRKGIPETGDRCYCPPGWYAQFCEIRGCRPPLNDNLNVGKRSFMLVLPVTKSMDPTRKDLENSLMKEIARISFFDNYILNMVVQVNATSYMSYITVGTNLEAFVNNMKNTTIAAQLEPDLYPIMQSLVDIQQYTRQMNPNSIIFVFTDSPDKDAGPVSYTINDNTLELQATQTTMLWRSRAFIFFINDPTRPVNTSQNSYDTYRRMVTFSHGDLFVINRNEVQTVIQNVLPLFDMPEYIDVRSFAQCDNLVLDLVRDDPTQNAYIIVTIDSNENTPSNVTITAWDTLLGATQLKTDQTGPQWATFIVPSGWDSVKINVSPKAICSAKAFISTPTTLLWAYSDDDYIDVGNCMNLAEMPMMITLQPIGFPLFSDFYVEFTNQATNKPFSWPMAAIVRKEPDCTFVYKIPNLPRCAAGPYTQKYTFKFTTPGKFMRRIHPGFCSHGDKNNGTQTIVQQYPTQGNGTGNTCYRQNVPDMGGKLHDFRQVIFALELVQEMNETNNDLVNMIDSITKDITNADSFRRQFSFVIFDSVGWKAVISDYDPAQFTAKFKKYFKELSSNALHVSNGAFSPDAVFHSIGLEIVSPAIIHVFTMSSPKSSDFYRVLPIDVQVNFFYFSPNADLPNYNDFRTIQKQTGGRLIALAALQDSQIFTSSIYSNNLLEDTGYSDCSKTVQVGFQVEKAASIIEVTTLAFNLNLNGFTLMDGNKTNIDLSKEKTILKSPSTLIHQINTAGKTSGTWTASVTTPSSCYLQVRAKSDVNVAVGFTEDPSDDFPARHPFNKRGQNDTTLTVVRATTGTVTKVTVQQTDFNRPWTDGNANAAVTLNDFTKYNENTCTYQFRSKLFKMPVTANSVRLLVTGTDAAGSSFQRLFNYYTPEDGIVTILFCSKVAILDAQECNGGKVNAFGQCSCPGNFTGEYCWDRVCAYGSTPSHGICMCWSFYYGERCENVRYVISSATEPPYPPPPSTMPPPVTQPPKVAWAKSYETVLLVLIHIFICF